MAKIQPLTLWINGETKEATNFNLRSIADNLSLVPFVEVSTNSIGDKMSIIQNGGMATFYYELQSTTTDEQGNETYENIITANLDISGADYESWNNDTTSNAWAYNWAAAKLKLILIP